MKASAKIAAYVARGSTSTDRHAGLAQAVAAARQVHATPVQVKTQHMNLNSLGSPVILDTSNY